MAAPNPCFDTHSHPACAVLKKWLRLTKETARIVAITRLSTADLATDDPMITARPLPAYLVQRFHGWRATSYQDNKVWYRRLAASGQHPRAMVISCCDSRVHVTSIFGADEGEFFIHRNVANLVPPYNPDGEYHGTSAAVEYAVNALGVAHVVVLGHSNCGGVKGCHDMCSGHAPELLAKTSFVGRWMDILRPGYDRIANLPMSEQIGALEREAVLVSLENLMTFPFVRDAVTDDRLTLHGLWNDTGEGRLEQYDAEKGFVPV
jgi:carbonic anhydrase